MGQSHPKVTKQWADSPFELIETPRKRLGGIHPKKASGAINAATEMALVHNLLIRSLNAIYLQAPNVKLEADIKDFTTFMHGWCIMIHEHHGNEEKFFFPWLEDYIGIKDYLHKNIDQHHAFAPGMQAFEDYVDALREGKEKYDGEKIRSFIDDFGAIFTQHLKEEIGTLEELDRFGDKIDWKTWNKKVTKVAIDTAEKDHEIPLGISNIDITFEGTIHKSTWPPFPWFAALMFRWVYMPRHKGAWRFSSCDWHGRPKDLEFV